MIISLIVAVDDAGGIGKEGTIPWHLRSDLQRFKQITMGHTLVMGRKTFDSIGRALPGRTNIVITRNRDFTCEDCLPVSNLKRALSIAKTTSEEEVFIIGGGEIFRQALKLADRVYLTRVHTVADCQVFFPLIDWSDWEVILEETHPAGDHDDHPSTYYLLQRKAQAVSQQ